VSGRYKFLQELVSQEEGLESESRSCGDVELVLLRSFLSTSKLNVGSGGFEFINFAISSSTSGMLERERIIIIKFLIHRYFLC
jgi:hypothetical protein